MIGIICFLIIVVLANILTFYVSNPVYQSGVVFLNTNFWLLLIIGIILFIADIFAVFPFPLNLPFPVIRAIGSVFIIAFVLRIFAWVDQITANNLYHFFWLISFVIVPVVFIIVIVTGYYEIICDLASRARLMSETAGIGADDHILPAVPPDRLEAKSWEDIAAEFRLMLYDIIHRFREEIRKM
jgi:hypothetical protein